jgi:uncharacterized protein involved in tolerance to divalent cations
MKTFSEKLECLKDTIKKNHSYDIPEIIAISVKMCNEKYSQWMKEVIK